MTIYEHARAESPRYRAVQQEMLDALARSEWRPGEVIPSEKRLCERFGVSIGTLRKAIDGLVSSHILVRQQGLGTFVASHDRPRQFFQFFNFAPHEGARTYPEVRLLQVSSAKADRLVAEKLNLEPGAELYKIRNLLLMGELPTIVDTIFLPKTLFAGLFESMIRDRPSTLYSLYAQEFGVNVIRIDERVRAAAATATSAKLLGLRAGSPVLEVRRIAFSFNDQPIEWRISHVNTNRHEYVHRDALRS